MCFICLFVYLLLYLSDTDFIFILLTLVSTRDFLKIINLLYIAIFVLIYPFILDTDLILTFDTSLDS